MYLLLVKQAKQWTTAVSHVDATTPKGISILKFCDILLQNINLMMQKYEKDPIKNDIKYMASTLLKCQGH